MEVKATLEERTSKSGNPYKVVVIKLTDNYEKLVFLDKSELELLALTNNSNKMPDINDPFFK